MCGPLLKAIGRFDSRRKFAIKLGVSPERLNAWLNRGVNIPKHYAEIIEQLCEGEVTWQELAPHLVHFKQKSLLSSEDDCLFCEAVNLSLSRIQYSYLPSEINEKVNVLLEDIKQRGLQKPICVDTENQLIFGKKRLQVYELLSKKTIPAWRLSLNDFISGKYSTEQLTKIFSISERVAISIAIKKQLGRCQGQRSDLELRQNFDEVKGRTDELITKLLGFGNRQTYHQAKKICQLGCDELINAVDKNQIAISTAALIAQLSYQEQRQILSLSSKEIAAAVHLLRKLKASSSVQLSQINNATPEIAYA